MQTILIVDDFDSIRSFIGQTLQREGYQVLFAVDGQDAFHKLMENQVDLIVSDFNMPNMNGLDLLKKIRGLDKFRSTPFFIISTKADTKAVLEGKKLGLNGWVKKPYNQQVFFSQIKYALKGSKLTYA